MNLIYNPEFHELALIDVKLHNSPTPLGLVLGAQEIEQLVAFMKEQEIIPNTNDEFSKYEVLIDQLHKTLENLERNHKETIEALTDKLRMEHLTDLRMQVGIAYHLLKGIPKNPEKSLMTPSGNAHQ